MNKRELFYERFASEFDSKMNMNDTRKRVDLMYSRLLRQDEIRDKNVLDAGSGTGWFSARAKDLGARVTSLDVGTELLKQVRQKCDTHRIVGDIQRIPIDSDTFDIVVSSEVIEHVKDPFKAICELHRVLRPGGILALTTPNRFWKFAVVFGNVFRLRPYQGLENWISWRALRSSLIDLNMDVEDMFGFHALPFVSPKLYSTIDYLDRYGDSFGSLMVNMGVRARK